MERERVPSSSSSEESANDEQSPPSVQEPSGPESSEPPTTQASSSAASTQKRRRVTRACDECRRKKIKCDGMQPCTHCTVYSYGKFPFMICVKSCLLQDPATDGSQNAPMISLRTEDVILHLNMSPRWKTGCNVPKLFFETLFQMSTSMTPNLMRVYHNGSTRESSRKHRHRHLRRPAQ